MPLARQKSKLIAKNIGCLWIFSCNATKKDLNLRKVAKPGDTEQSKDGFTSTIAGFREKIEQL